MNCTRWEPWRIIQLAADVGDTNEFLCRLDTDGSSTISDTPAGSTAMTVATPSGPLWVTGSGDDFPLDVNAGGWQITVNSIINAASPQVFTLAAPTPADIPAGSPVSVWLPTYLTM